jgi:hypothetical protein
MLAFSLPVLDYRKDLEMHKAVVALHFSPRRRFRWLTYKGSTTSRQDNQELSSVTEISLSLLYMSSGEIAFSSGSIGLPSRNARPLFSLSLAC